MVVIEKNDIHFYGTHKGRDIEIDRIMNDDYDEDDVEWDDEEYFDYRFDIKVTDQESGMSDYYGTWDAYEDSNFTTRATIENAVKEACRGALLEWAGKFLQPRTL
jgi:hypothetical protein